MKERTKAYVAGLMDAEGCFSIYKATPQPGGRTPYQPRIVLATVEGQLAKWLVKTFGGFYTRHSPVRGDVWYQWNLNGKTAAPLFLSHVLPYLRIKKREAEVLRDFYALGSGPNPERRQELMTLIRAMKNRECLTTDTLDGHVEDKQTHAYLAGIVDGEGCISAAFAPSGKPMFRIRMGNNFLPLVKLFQHIYGGWYHTKPAHDSTEEFYTWEITTKEEKERFLLQTLPYLRVKREQAKVALELARLPSSPNRDLRTKLCNQIRLLNAPKIQSELVGDHESAVLKTAPA